MSDFYVFHEVFLDSIVLIFDSVVVLFMSSRILMFVFNVLKSRGLLYIPTTRSLSSVQVRFSVTWFCLVFIDFPCSSRLFCFATLQIFVGEFFQNQRQSEDADFHGEIGHSQGCDGQFGRGALQGCQGVHGETRRSVSSGEYRVGYHFLVGCIIYTQHYIIMFQYVQYTRVGVYHVSSRYVQYLPVMTFYLKIVTDGKDDRQNCGSIRFNLPILCPYMIFCA